jgi:TolB-like protein
MSLFAELRRRNVFRVGAAYAVVAWLIIEVADTILPRLGVPDWSVTFVIVALMLGFPVAMLLSWAYELTPAGVKRSDAVSPEDSVAPATGRRIDRVVIVALAAVIALLLGARFWPGAERAGTPTLVDQAPAVANAAAAQASVAVLPFVAMSRGPDDEYFADGLTEELLNSLAALPDLLVTARTSSFHFKGRDVPIPEVARTLGVGHVVEGSVRRSGEKLRITAQLIRARDGFHLWSETYDRELSDVFAVQLDIAHNIAEALDVVLDESSRRRMHEAGVQDVDAYIAFQKGFALYDAAHRDLPRRNAILAEGIPHFEQATARVADFYAAHLYHSDLYAHRLLDTAMGRHDPDLTPELLAEARVRLRADLEAAIRHGGTPARRASADYTRILFADSWRGIAQAAERVSAAESCVPTLYLHFMMAFGRATQNRMFFERQVACDPLDHDQWSNVIAALLWEGSPADVIARARQAEARAGASQWLDQDVMTAQMILGDFAAADATLLSPALSDEERDDLAVALLAVQGQLDAARKAADGWFARHGQDDTRALRFAAWLGDRAGANAVAARIDARSVGAVALANATELCRCGAPFDLEATPGFAARLAEAGLTWPPRTLLRFPAKAW